MNLRQFFDRYGVPLGAILALALVVALLPGNASSRQARLDATGGVVAGAGGNRTTGTGPSAGGAGAGGTAAGGAGTAAGGTGGTGDAAGGGGGADGTSGGGGPSSGGVVFGSGPNCRADGRQNGISRYMPPCADWAPGTDNGGATADGVTGDKVVVVRWLGQLDAATKAILQQYDLSDDDATIRRAFDALFQYSNQHYETYGREVVFVDFKAHAESTNDEVMIADATQIADMHPFAVVEGNPAAPMPTVMMRELSARGVLCLCSTSLTAQFYGENPFVIDGGLPIADEYCKNSAEYAGKRLAGRNAAFAGDENNPLQHYKNSPRVFGLIYLNGAQQKVDPEGERMRKLCHDEFAAVGINFAKEIGYLYDPGRNQNDMTNIVAQMKDAGVTTVVGLYDPLTPILLTTAASEQQYFPEWFVTGTALSDTTTAARLYNPLQWSHAFGITPVWVSWIDRRNGGGYRAYHHARPQDPDGAEGVLIEVYLSRIQLLFRGIHMAGPALTPDTFRAGLWSFPPTPEDGGHAALPYVYQTPDSPGEAKDFAEVWYDPNARGPDERSKQGTGMMMKSDGGKRYQLGQWPTDDPHIRQPGALAVSDNPEGGSNFPHEQDGHTHTTRCLSCPT